MHVSTSACLICDLDFQALTESEAFLTSLSSRSSCFIRLSCSRFIDLEQQFKYHERLLANMGRNALVFAVVLFLDIVQAALPQLSQIDKSSQPRRQELLKCHEIDSRSDISFVLLTAAGVSSREEGYGSPRTKVGMMRSSWESTLDKSRFRSDSCSRVVGSAAPPILRRWTDGEELPFRASLSFREETSF